MRNRWIPLIAGLFMSVGAAHADITLLLEEPFGTFGGMNPTGHAAVYLSRICADSADSLRRCREGETGVVISRYHRVTGHDWLAVPLTPYLYAVDRPEDVPSSVDQADVAALRDAWRRKNLTEFIPNADDGGTPDGEWIQLVGAAYDRTIYAFGMTTTEDQDDKLIALLNSRPNERRFNLLFHNCADFARGVVDFYYPHAIHRNFIADVGIMTPKQAAESFVNYSKNHSDLQLSTFVISQVPGTIPRSSAVRGVLQSLVKSKRYALPLAMVAALHPYVGGSMIFAWVEGRKFDPRRIAESAEPLPPEEVVSEFEENSASLVDQGGPPVLVRKTCVTDGCVE